MDLTAVCSKLSQSIQWVREVILSKNRATGLFLLFCCSDELPIVATGWDPLTPANKHTAAITGDSALHRHCLCITTTNTLQYELKPVESRWVAQVWMLPTSKTMGGIFERWHNCGRKWHLIHTHWTMAPQLLFHSANECFCFSQHQMFWQYGSGSLLLAHHWQDPH